MAMSDVHVDLVCPVCLDVFDEPITLSCQHTVCRNCLRGLEDNEQEFMKIKCPSCRHYVKLSFSSIDLIPSNPILKSLVAQSKKLYKCFECKNLAKLKACAHCDSLLCNDCVTAHKPELFVALSAIVNTMEDSLVGLPHQLERIHDNEQEVKATADITKRAVSTQIDFYKHVLEVKESELHLEIDSIKQNDLKKLKQEAKRTKMMINVIPEKLDSAKKALDSWIELPEDLANFVKDDSTKDIDLNVYIPETISISYDSSLFAHFLDTLAVTGGSDRKQRPNFRSYRDLGLIPTHLKVDGGPYDLCCHKNELYALFAISYIVIDTNTYSVKREQYIPELSGPCGIAVHPSGRLAMSDALKHVVHLHGDDGNTKSIGQKGEGEGEFDYPDGVIYFNDELLVANRNNNRVEVLNLDGDFVRQVGVGVLKRPKGLAMRCDGKLCVSDSDGLKVFSADGQHFTTVGIQNRLSETQEFGARGIAVDAYNYILICDTNKNLFRVLNPDFTENCTFGKDIYNDTNVICVLSNGKIAFSDIEKNRITIL